MKQFKNILLVAPIDNQLVAQSLRILNTSHSKVTLMSVAPVIENAKVETKPGKVVDLQKLLRKDIQEELEKSISRFKDKDVRVKSVVVAGHSSIEIIKQVVTKKHDLVMMMADGVNSLRAQIFGTLSLHLMRKCPCPVWVLKPSRRKKPRNVFAAVDPDQRNETRDQLNAEILCRASAIAKSENANLHVIHAWNSLTGDASRGRRWMSKPEIRIHLEKTAAEHRRLLKELLDRETDGWAITHMLQGPPGTVIPKVVDKEKADLLVMGTVSRVGIPGFFIGNTAETILGQVDCSVLTVKPAGFVSPMKFE